MDGMYQGLSKSQRMWIVGVAACIFLINIVLAWLMMNKAIANLQFSELDQKVVTAISEQTEGKENEIVLRAHAIDAVISIKLIANKQAIILAAYGGAFGLCAAGFALFLIGADGAFQFNVQQPGNGAKVVLSSTAPGLFCFFVAGVLILAGIQHTSEINSNPVNITKESPVANKPPMANKPLSDDELRRLGMTK